MSNSLASKVILKYSEMFIYRNVLFAGHLQDKLPISLKTLSSRVHTQQYHYWQSLNQYLGDNVIYSLLATDVDVKFCDTLIYFWPKNKLEAKFHLQNLFSLLPIGSHIFLVGDTHSGLCSAKNMLDMWIYFDKIDRMKHCIFYYGKLKQQSSFNISNFINTYLFDQVTIHTLPGVFSYSKLDRGSNLLISTFTSNIKGKILDIGSGSGVLSVFLSKSSANQVDLWLCDVHAAAVEASKATLLANGINGYVFPSNIFSNVTGYFDLIISNPPFHNDLKINFNIAHTIIREAVRYLNKGGELRIVGNTFLFYPQILYQTFGNYKILVQNNQYKVYSSIYN